MTAQSIVCGACGTSVPYGRLSCPSCGELLASVAGARRPSSIASTAVSDGPPAVLHDVDPGPAIAVVDGQLALGVAPDAEDAAPWPDATDTADDAPLELDQRSNGLAHDDYGLAYDHDGRDNLVGSGDDAEPLIDVTSRTAGHAWAVQGASMTGPTTPAYMPRPNYARSPAPETDDAAATSPPLDDAPIAAQAPALQAPALQAPAVPFDAPGAYVPPMPVVSVPAGPVAPARAWAGHVNGTEAGLADLGTARSRDRSIDPSRLAEFIGSVSVAGAALGAVGFLLPWANVMIGSTGVGYFDRWGLAGPAHFVVVIGVLALVALSVLKNPVPTWIRTGIGGLGLGALLLGLTWPYLLGPLEAAPGVLIEAIGAVALIGSGILALVTDRHAEAGRAV